MRYLVFARLRYFGERACAFEHVGPEERVVAETAFTLGLVANPSFDGAARSCFRTILVDEHERSNEPCRALTIGRIRQVGNQLLVVIGVGGILAGKTRRVNPRRAVQRIDFQA